jgi:argininosuccinate lyase
MKRGRGGKAATLWSSAGSLDAQMLQYTVADDRVWDARLMPWDILGSIAHAEGLRRAKLLSVNEHRRLVGALRSALRAAERGELVIGPEHEDVHSAVELWLTERLGALGERVHTGRSRNDQVTVDLRLFLKHRVLDLPLPGHPRLPRHVFPGGRTGKTARGGQLPEAGREDDGCSGWAPLG